MCEFFDASWQLVLGFVLLFALATVVVRIKTAMSQRTGETKAPSLWIVNTVFWGSGLVGLCLIALVAFSLLCAGSPGDPPLVVPN